MLNLPEAKLKIRQNANGRLEVFDIIRKKYVSFTPEENVRQQFISFLISEKDFPQSLIAVEKGLTGRGDSSQPSFIQIPVGQFLF
jgi:hypothetical protein